MKKVLVVEDNEMTIEIYKLVFKKYIPNVEVEYINNGEDAIERVTRNGFDLLIADYNLRHPTINGMDVARLVYPLGKPILIVSGHKIIPRMMLYCKYSDMCKKVSFLSKPFKLKKLIKTIKVKLEQPSTPLNEMFEIITQTM